jgi:hypothetical protein
MSDTTTYPVETEPHGTKQLLKCPQCGDSWMHQMCVDVFSRAEDSENPTHVRTKGDSVSIDRDNEDNPSSRRSGIRIGFSCELCDQTRDGPEIGAWLCIVQHKGNERIYWELADE